MDITITQITSTPTMMMPAVKMIVDGDQLLFGVADCVDDATGGGATGAVRTVMSSG